MPVSYGLDDTAAAPPCKRANTWCLPWYGGGGDDGDDDETDYDRSEAGNSPASTSASAPQTNTLANGKPSRVRTETTPMMFASINSGTGGDTFSSNAGDGLKPRSLLAQPHIRTLLFIDVLYSVGVFGSGEHIRFALVESSNRRAVTLRFAADRGIALFVCLDRLRSTLWTRTRCATTTIRRVSADPTASHIRSSMRTSNCRWKPNLKPNHATAFLPLFSLAP